jgi:hemerythrin
MFFVWDNAYDTGIEAIDMQHRKIVDYINQLDSAISSNNTDEIEKVFENLFNYCLSHFSFEESLMEEHGYEHTEGHRMVHNSFTDRITRYRLEWTKGKTDVSRRLLSDLKVWLVSHIQREDQFYAEDIRNKLDQNWISKMLKKFFPN